MPAKRTLTLTAGLALLVLIGSSPGALTAQQITTRQAAGADRLTARIDVLEASNQQLQQQVAALEERLAQMGAVEREAPSERLLGSREQVRHTAFRMDVLGVMAPYLEQLEELAAAHRDHRHFVMRRAARGYANHATLRTCNDCLVPYISVENQGKESDLYTDPPRSPSQSEGAAPR
jgi:hypothetical protein